MQTTTPHPTTAAPRRVSISPFVVVAYAITWLIWLPRIAFSRGLSPYEPPVLLHMLGSYGPGLAALGLLAREGGVRAWLTRFTHWRVPIRWYLVVALPVGVVALLVALVSSLSGVTPTLGPSAWSALLGAVLYNLALGGPLGEEGGWRGYALPRLLRGRSALSASLLVGLIWFVWHAPGFLDPANPLGQPVVIPIYLLFVMAVSMLMTWVYLHTDGSLLVAVLFHATLNLAGYAVPLLFADDLDAITPFLGAVSVVYLALPMVAALLVILIAGPSLRRSPRRAIDARGPRKGLGS